VDDAAEVHVVERAGDLHRDDRGDVVGEAAALLEEVVQVDALHVLHHDEHRAAFLVVVVNVDDVLVLQVRETLRFSLEPRDHVLLRGGAGLQRLDRDGAPERVLHRAINHRHAARGDLFDDPAVPNPFEHPGDGHRTPKAWRISGGWAEIDAVRLPRFGPVVTNASLASRGSGSDPVEKNRLEKARKIGRLAAGGANLENFFDDR
jgi:hypothetical protein